MLLGEVGAILIGLWHFFFQTDHSVLDKLFELCPFMQTVIPDENHVELFPYYSYSVLRNRQF